MPPGDFLSFIRIKVFEIGSSDLLGLTLLHHFIHHADAWLRQDTERRNHNFEFIFSEFLHGQKRLVFPGDEDIADSTLDKRRGRTARA